MVLTYAEIDRIFYEYPRRELVRLGYLPDVFSYAAGQQAQYQAARESIAANGTLIDIFGIGSSIVREGKYAHRYTISRSGKRVGTIGGSPATYLAEYVDNGVTKYEKRLYPDQSNHLDYEIRVISTQTDVSRVMCDILDKMLPGRNMIRTITPQGTSSTRYVMVRFTGDVDLSFDGYVERVYKYEVLDVFLQPETLLRKDIPIMNTVEWCIHDFGETFTVTGKVDMQ